MRKSARDNVPTMLNGALTTLLVNKHHYMSARLPPVARKKQHKSSNKCCLRVVFLFYDWFQRLNVIIKPAVAVITLRALLSPHPHTHNTWQYYCSSCSHVMSPPTLSPSVTHSFAELSAPIPITDIYYNFKKIHSDKYSYLRNAHLRSASLWGFALWTDLSGLIWAHCLKTKSIEEPLVEALRYKEK